MSTLYLARHGQTFWNVEGRKQGRAGGELTPKGRAQAHALATFARWAEVTRVISSPLQRAHETAKLAAAAVGVELELDDALVELDFGDCSGLTDAEIDARFPGLLEVRELDKWRARWPGGESYADAERRVTDFVERTRRLDGVTLVVAHQSVNRAISRRLVEASAAEVLAMAQPSDVVLRFEGARVAHAPVVAEPRWSHGLYGAMRS